MPNYLTKEEIRQWRSSLEKITLEEFAARLGKEVEETKPTNDTSSVPASKITEDFSKIAERAFARERQISHTPFSISRNELAGKAIQTDTTFNKKIESQNKQIIEQEAIIDKAEELAAHKEVHITLKKALTDREQLVFDYLMNNVGKTVYAKDLAKLLDLPRDYVYKYIKNLRAKIEGDKLKNVPSGGFVLSE